MQCLQSLIEKGSVTEELLEEHFKSLLLILLETLGDANVSLACLCLLYDVCKKKKNIQKMYIELTYVVKIT